MVSPARPANVRPGSVSPGVGLTRTRLIQIVGATLVLLLLAVYPLLEKFDINVVGLVVRHDVGVSTLADTGVYVLLALGLNIVVGYAGLLDLGYAAFFAIGSYTYALLASGHFNAPVGIHLSF